MNHVGLLANAHDNITRLEIMVNKVTGVDILQAAELNTDIRVVQSSTYLLLISSLILLLI